jgi:hypothetical protein
MPSVSFGSINSNSLSVLILPSSVKPSNLFGNVKVPVSGIGFTPNTLVNLGYYPSFYNGSDYNYSNSIFATTTNSTGGWSGNFSGPWQAGAYKLVAIDADGLNAMATLNVNNSAGVLLILPTTTLSSTSKGDVNVIVSGTGFTPNTLVNLGYSSNFPPYSNAIFATTTNSTGGWTGVFSAPWAINLNPTSTYDMTAIDAYGITANAQLVVTEPQATLSISSPTPISNSSVLVKVPVSGTGFTPNSQINLGYYGSFYLNGTYNYANSIFSTTTNSTGGWSGNFSAPWTVGEYKLIAVDSQGVYDVQMLAAR